MPSKKELREAMLSRLMAQNQAERDRRSFVIQQKLFSLPVFQKSRCVFFFVSMPEEVHTHDMIDQALAAGKRVAVPRADLKTREQIFFEIHNRKTDLRAGVYGIWEPDPVKTTLVSPDKADLVVVPGVVFDKNQNRIGRGAGFYDRFLKKISAWVPKVGLAYSFQVVNELPVESYDVALNEVITD